MLRPGKSYRALSEVRNQLLTMSGQVNETRTYNVLLQLTSVTSAGYFGNTVNVSSVGKTLTARRGDSPAVA